LPMIEKKLEKSSYTCSMYSMYILETISKAGYAI